jgi:hypothetical protein
MTPEQARPYLAWVVNSEGHADAESFDEQFENGPELRKSLRPYMEQYMGRLVLLDAGDRAYYGRAA